jgi:HEAT repeat protein
MSERRAAFLGAAALWLNVALAAAVCGPLPAAAGEEDPLIGDKPLSELVKQLKSENKGLQLRAAKALIEAPAELRPKMMPRMMELLKSERENDKFVAAQVLGECGPAARAAVPGLLPMLEGTQYERNRTAAAKALGQILQDAKPDDEVEKVTAKLVSVFRDKYPDVQRESVKACGMIGPAAKGCLPHLTEPLEFAIYGHGEDEPYHMVRCATAWTLGRMGALSASYMDRLIAKMHIEGARSPEFVEAMGLIGPTNENVVPNIVDCVEAADLNIDRGTGFRARAFAALARFGPKAEKAMPFVKRFLSKPPSPWEEQWKRATIEALKLAAAVGPKGKDALPEIEKLTQYEVKDDLCKALREEAVKAAAALKGEK